MATPPCSQSSTWGANEVQLPNRKMTPADLEKFVAHEYFFTASQGVRAAGYLPLDDLPGSLCCMTFCVIVMTNGYILTGQSACADPADFNADLGQKLARQDAIKQMWPLVGFVRRDQLHEAEKG